VADPALSLLGAGSRGRPRRSRRRGHAPGRGSRPRDERGPWPRSSATHAYDEMCSRCFEINVRAQRCEARASGEDLRHGPLRGIFESYLGRVGQERVIDAVRAAGKPVHRARGRLGWSGLQYARHARGVASSSYPRPRIRVAFAAPGPRPRVRTRDHWAGGEAVVPGWFTPDHARSARPTGRILNTGRGQDRGVGVRTTRAGRVSRPRCPARLVSQRVLDERSDHGDHDASPRRERH